MVSLGHQYLPSIDLGRLDEEAASPGGSHNNVELQCAGNRLTLELAPVDTVWMLLDGVVVLTGSWFKITRSVVKSSRVAEQYDVNIPSLTH
ncbi:hypothetical protein TNCV_3901481 [Trichonephila clavipes]|nr:hypothetical protein TNCV_3901481 [Trichonephila clavipes]